MQTALDVKELAEYRLTTPVFTQFNEASRIMAVAMRNDSALASNPLFTRSILVLGDAPTVAAALEARLQNHPLLADALRTAQITPREYTKFALALFAARLAHGFVSAGVLRRVPAGVAAANVQFVDAHQPEIAAVLKDLGIEPR